MVTLKRSHFYTTHAIKSFFKYTEIENEDEFLLINNDNCETAEFSTYSKINIINNEQPLGFAENVNQGISAAIKKKKESCFFKQRYYFN